MTEPRLEPGGYAVGSFVVDVVRKTLTSGSTPVPINGKTFDVLAVLIAHRDRLVTKEELLAAVWPDTFVHENNLARHVSTIRRLLGERPGRSTFIATVQGRGYRFVGPVRELAA